MRSTPTYYLHLGNAVLHRFSSETLSPLVKPAFLDFKNRHGGYLKAQAKVDATHVARDEAFRALGDADDRVDSALMSLADRIVGEGLNARKNPFKGFSAHAPTELASLGYEREAKEARLLVKKVTKKAPKKGPLLVALKQVDKDAVVVESLLAAIGEPVSAHTKAVAARDALLIDWHDALGRLKRRAAVEWENEPEKVQLLFADPIGIEAGVSVERTKSAKGKKRAQRDDKKAEKKAAKAAVKAARDAKATKKAAAMAAMEAAMAAAMEATSAADAKKAVKGKKKIAEPAPTE